MNNIHCIPAGNGEPNHECHTLCWCHPVKDTESKNLYVHNAKYCHEKWERQGLGMPPLSLWVTVEEKLNAAKANPIDEVVKRMQAVPVDDLRDEYMETLDDEIHSFEDRDKPFTTEDLVNTALEAVRTSLIQAAKGEQL